MAEKRSRYLYYDRHSPHWRERSTGHFFSFVIVGAMLAVMAVMTRPERPPDPVEFEVLINLSDPEETPLEPEPEPEPEEEILNPPTPQDLSEAAATRRESNELGEQLVNPAPLPEEEPMELLEQQEATDSQAEEASLSDWIPTNQEAATLQALREEVDRQTAMLSERRDALQQKIVRAEVDSAARQWELDSDGGLQGAIRMLDVDAFPEDITIPVLRRYGITMERRFTSPKAGRSFLNAATTNQGTFRNVEKEGFYDVMTLSAKAVAFMSRSETDALNERGYDPRTTRVRKIVFGIIKKNDQYELAVTDLEVEKVR